MGDVFGLSGQRLDLKYDVDAVVAEGGFGVVYRATHCSLRRRVAIKVLRVPDGLDDATRDAWMRQFAREAQTIARLDHPAIVGVVDFGVSTMPSGARAPWMALEWIDGRTLSAELAAGRRAHAPAEALARLRPVISALAFAHAAGVSHRDVKPSNVMCLDAPGEGPSLRLVDFGVAKAHDVLDDARGPSGETATRSAVQAYSLPYAAPEQVSATRTGPWTDVHALGLMLTELLTGRAPYPGSDAMDLCADVLAPERPTPARAGVDVGAWEPVLARAVALRPAARYPDAGALLAALDAALPAVDATSRRRMGPRAVAASLAMGAAVTGALAFVAAHRASPRGTSPDARVAAVAPPPAAHEATAPAVTAPAPVVTAPAPAPAVAAPAPVRRVVASSPHSPRAPSWSPRVPVAEPSPAAPVVAVAAPSAAPSRIVLAPAE